MTRTATSDAIRVTYEVSFGQPLHPDLQVCARMVEIALSDCDHGCKIYADPRSELRVLGHSRAYGCRK